MLRPEGESAPADDETGDSVAETDIKQEAGPVTVEVAGQGAAAGGGLVPGGVAGKKVELDLDDAPFLQNEEKASAPAPRDADVPANPDEDAPAPDTGKKRKRLLILAGIGAGVLLVAAAAIWWFVFRTPPPPPPQTPGPQVVVVPSAPAPQQKREIIKEFAPFVVPETDASNGARFLVCKFSAILTDPALEHEVDQHMLSLRDAIYFYLRSKDDAFLADAHNGPEIKRDLLSVLNDYLTQGKIEDILFESYLSR